MPITPEDIKNYALASQQISSGLIFGGALSVNVDPTKFDVLAGKCLFVDYSDINFPVGYHVDFGPFTAVSVDNMLTSIVSYIGIDATGQIVQQPTLFTPAQSRYICSLGAVIHSNHSTINAINTITTPQRSPLNQLHDLMYALGPFNVSGNNYTPNGANLSINRSDGQIFRQGSNYLNNLHNPHIINTAAESPVTFRYRLRDATEYSDTTFIDPNNYDLNSVLTAVPNNKWTIQRVYLFASGLSRIQYGQTIYQNLDEALQRILIEPFVVEDNAASAGILRSFIVVKSNTTNLNTAGALIINNGKFNH